jgi:predicted phage tail protein
MNATIVDVLIENIKTDQNLLQETEQKIEQAKEAKRSVVDRLKDYRKDVSVLLKYADKKQQEKISELGFDFSETERGLNAVAQLALELVMKAKGNQLTNGALYDAYKKTFKNESDAFSYTEFNIKCRSLFNTQRLLRKKGKDPKNSKEAIISLNGRVIEKTEAKKETNETVSK